MAEDIWKKRQRAKEDEFFERANKEAFAEFLKRKSEAKGETPTEQRDAPQPETPKASVVNGSDT